MPQFSQFPGTETLFSIRTGSGGVLRITGRDRIAFLTRIMSGDLPAAPGAARTTLLGPKGNLIAAAVATVTGQEVLLECERSREHVLLAALDRYRIADDVELALAEPDEIEIVGADGARAPEAPDAAPRGSVRETGAGYVRRDFRPWHATTTVHLGGVPAGSGPPADAGPVGGAAVAATAEQQEYLRILAGEPRWGAELDERSLPLQSGLAAHVRLGKGCYIGQEYVARQAHRGRIPRLLRRLDFDAGAPEAGAELLFDGRPASRTTSAAARPAGWRGPAGIALAALPAEIPPGAQVATPDGVTARVAAI